MSDLALVVHQLRYSGRAYRRNPLLVVLGVAFPLMFLVVLGSALEGERIDELSGLPWNRYFVPQVIALAVMGACYTNLATVVAARRETGELKRLRATPLRPRVLVIEMIASAVLLALVLAAVTVVAGRLLYAVPMPRFAVVVPAVITGAAAFAALGVAVASAFRSADVANVGVNVTFWPLTFLSGTFFVVDDASWLARVASVFPVQHFNKAVFAAYDPTAAGVPVAHLLVLLAWGLAGAALAARLFRWEPS